MESELKCLTSESGRFHVDAVGVVRRFEPADDNPLVDAVEDLASPFCLSGEGLRLYEEDWVKWHKTIRTLIIPRGVTEFGGEFMRSVHVRERFELPEGIVRIGFHGNGCVFAECRIPYVAIPETVQEIGGFCFGNSLIHRLRLPLLNRCEYERQFKGSTIEVLELPSVLKDCVRIDGWNKLELVRKCDLSDGPFGCLGSIGVNARVGRLQFY